MSIATLSGKPINDIICIKNAPDTDNTQQARDIAAKNPADVPKFHSVEKTQGGGETFNGAFTPPAGQSGELLLYTLAIHSDDGVDVTVDGNQVHGAFGKDQALENSGSSFKVLDIVLVGGEPTNISVKYSNTIYNGENDIDGCTLYVCLIPATIKIHDTENTDDDYLIGDAKGEFDNPIGTIEVGGDSDWSAGLSSENGVIEFSNANMSGSNGTSNYSDIWIKKDHVFTTKETEVINISLSLGQSDIDLSLPVDLFPVIVKIGEDSASDDYLLGDGLGKSDNPTKKIEIEIVDYPNPWTADLSSANDVVEFTPDTVSGGSASGSSADIKITDDHEFSAKEQGELTIDLSIGDIDFSLDETIDLYPAVMTMATTDVTTDDVLYGDAQGGSSNPAITFKMELKDFPDAWTAELKEDSNIVEFESKTLSYSAGNNTKIKIKNDHKFSGKENKEIKADLTAGADVINLTYPIDLFPVLVKISGTEDYTDDHLFGHFKGISENPTNILEATISGNSRTWTADYSEATMIVESDVPQLTGGGPQPKGTANIKIKDIHKFDKSEDKTIKLTFDFNYQENVSLIIEKDVKLYPVKIRVSETENTEDDLLLGDPAGIKENPTNKLDVEIVGFADAWTSTLTNDNGVIIFNPASLDSAGTMNSKIKIKKGHKFLKPETEDVVAKFTIGTQSPTIKHPVELLPVEIEEVIEAQESAGCTGYDEDENALMVPMKGSNKIKVKIAGATPEFLQKIKFVATAAGKLTIAPEVPTAAEQELILSGTTAALGVKVQLEIGGTKFDLFEADVLKKRTEKIHIYVVKESSANANVKKPNIGTLKKYVNKIYNRQSNIFLSELTLTEVISDYDINSDGALEDDKAARQEIRKMLVDAPQKPGKFDYYIVDSLIDVSRAKYALQARTFAQVGMVLANDSKILQCSTDYIFLHEFGHLLGRSNHWADQSKSDYLMADASISKCGCQIGRKDWQIMNP